MRWILSLAILWMFAGCYGVRDTIQTEPLVTTPVVDDKNFHTDMTHFHTALENIHTKVQRNRLLEDLVTASNMECSAFQYRSSETEETSDTVYTDMFKIVGKYIGWDIAKDAISAVSLISDMGDKKSNQDKYAQALKPNIIKAIQIAREKYLTKMKASKSLDLKTYSVRNLQTDLVEYDKRCSTYYGLMEITRALENRPEDSKSEAKKIDVDEVKVKIKEVTKAVRKKVWIDLHKEEDNCTIAQELNTTK